MRKSLLGYFLLALTHLAYIFAMRTVGLGNWDGLFLTNVSPLIVGEAVCLFEFFRAAGQDIRASGLRSRLMGLIAPGVYAVYVIHVHPQVFWSETLIALLRPWDAWSAIGVFAAMMAAAAGVFAVCILLDAARQRLFRVLGVDRAVEKLSDRAEYMIRKLLAEK